MRSLRCSPSVDAQIDQDLPKGFRSNIIAVYQIRDGFRRPSTRFQRLWTGRIAHRQLGGEEQRVKTLGDHCIRNTLSEDNVSSSNRVGKAPGGIATAPRFRFIPAVPQRRCPTAAPGDSNWSFTFDWLLKVAGEVGRLSRIYSRNVPCCVGNSENAPPLAPGRPEADGQRPRVNGAPLDH